MATINLAKIGHHYHSAPGESSDWALRQIDLDWQHGGAYALLGPSGCGKTTLLNIISGLLTPSQGRLCLDGLDVTMMPPEQRRIAQVFQFPVVYDTMTVYDNLAFPLRNRGVKEAVIRQRVGAMAELLELTHMLDRRAAGLTVDGKQKISLGRGLVRHDVNAVLFDEPLTVIDPHLKFLLRSKLKELHRQIDTTMIYVTHDQTEALTFADKVVVMKDGEIVQIGSPEALFETPQHIFVGHFIGSPGMNVIPCTLRNGAAYVNDTRITLSHRIALRSGRAEIGIRPEYVQIAAADDRGTENITENILAARVVKIANAGRFNIVDTLCGSHPIKVLVADGCAIPTDHAHLVLRRDKTRLYIDDRIAENMS